jgi:hypothetical protein
MKKIFLFYIVCVQAISCFAQKKTFDLVEYNVPRDVSGKNWKEERKKDITSYTTTNKKDGSWCLIYIVKSTISKGSIDADFENEWKELIVKNYNPLDTVQLTAIEEANGYKIKSGTSKFILNKKRS